MPSPPLGFLLSTLASALRENTEKQLADLGLTPREYGLLWRLADGPLSQRQLGELHRIDRTTVVGLLDRLEVARLVDRTVDATDRRRHAVSITDAGRTLLESATAVVDEASSSFTAALTTAERSTLLRLLVKLLEGSQP
ncbi:MAG TPA: MarR family transcriptional regulator [Acidimicrobiaceae bacterium]|nr:MarR family transcriptional regulator [Acidimicrobiaceae bacterium]